MRCWRASKTTTPSLSGEPRVPGCAPCVCVCVCVYVCVCVCFVMPLLHHLSSTPMRLFIYYPLSICAVGKPSVARTYMQRAPLILVYLLRACAWFLSMKAAMMSLPGAVVTGGVIMLRSCCRGEGQTFSVCLFLWDADGDIPSSSFPQSFCLNSQSPYCTLHFREARPSSLDTMAKDDFRDFPTGFTENRL